MRHSLLVKPTLLRVIATLTLAGLGGCATLHARPPAEAQRASLAVLCSDPSVDAPARWCGRAVRP
jgi:hypothetical protein